MELIEQDESLNVYGEPLIACSTDPVTGFFRDGCCNTSSQDYGSHTVCIQVTKEFLEYSRFKGNDLSTPIPEFGFPGLKAGDGWCLCAARWLEAEKPDIVHVHSRLPAWICWLAIKKVPVQHRPKLVTTMHGHYSVSGYSSVMAKGRRTIAVSDHIRRYTLKNYPLAAEKDVVTIHGGASRLLFPYAAGKAELKQVWDALASGLEVGQ